MDKGYQINNYNIVFSIYSMYNVKRKKCFKSTYCTVYIVDYLN